MKVGFKSILKKFDRQGEKTGWTYISVPQKIAGKLSPGNKKSFRVKGKLDEYPVHSIALLPMGEGHFIMAVNAAMRKALRKQEGAEVIVEIEIDTSKQTLSEDFLVCLEDEPAASQRFKKLPPSHQQYYSRWIESAKTAPTKAKRIALAVNTLSRQMNFSQMMQSQKK
ncbi:MAG TPA: YdeI/OmpD-associated family protein [Ferruginibacter sp.]|nr:YdeI/OmpD-associated family protein [Ferruginibacter sp.]